MNHFGKYFSIRVFCKTFVTSSLIVMIAFAAPQKEGKETEYEKPYKYSIQSDTCNTEDINYPIAGVTFDISKMLSDARYQQPTCVQQSADIVASGTSLVEDSEAIKEVETEKDTQSEEVETEQTEEKPQRSNKLYCIVENEVTYNLDVAYQDYLWETCEKYEVTDYYELFIAQMYHESGFQADIVSGTNDYGLMQINKCNHGWLSKKLGKSNFLDPYTSIEAGVYILSDYLKKYDDVQTALVCYNMGESAIQKGIYSTKYSRGVLADEKLLVELEN